MREEKRFICYWEYGVPKVEEYYSPKQVENRLKTLKELGFRVFHTSQYDSELWYKDMMAEAIMRENELWNEQTYVFGRIIVPTRRR